VLDVVEQGLGLSPQALAHSRAVLQDVGNVSSATLPFVLERILAEGAPGPGLAMALGPAPVARTFRFTLV
jgi:predicted naringenin-chalcone synthase